MGGGSDRGASFLSGGRAPHGGISFDWGVFEKNCRMVGVSAWRIGRAINIFCTKQTKVFESQNFRIFFLKVLTKFFVAPYINLESTLIYGGGLRQCVSKSIMGQAVYETKTQRKININTFKFYLC